MRLDDAQRALDAILRNDLASFVEKVFAHVAPRQQLHRGWHLRAIAHKLERCRRGECRRLIITMPPRHMKSICASIAFPAFVLGHDPTARIICASYSQELAANLARQSRSVMASPWYQRLFPGTRLSPERNAEADFMTTRRGSRTALSVGGSLTGRGGNYIIIDDAMKAEDALSEARRASTNNWFDQTLYTRLDNKSSDVIIIVMQRLHIDDFVGHVLAKGEGWEHLDLPAIAELEEAIPIGDGLLHDRRVGDLLSPGREPLPVLDELKRTLGSFAFSAQYQQRPIPVEGEIIKWSWFQRYDLPLKGHNSVCQSWDTAQKDGEFNDYSVCTTWTAREGQFYLLDLFRARLLYPELRRAVIEKQRQWQASTVLIEDKAAGTALLQELRYRMGCSVVPIEPKLDKVVRASASSILIEAGRVFLPRHAPWLKELQQEVVQFPEGRHDDQIDSIAQFLGWVEARKRSGRVMFVKPGGV